MSFWAFGCPPPVFPLLVFRSAVFVTTWYGKVRRGGAIVGLDDVGSIIIDLIREGRHLLTNTYQASITCHLTVPPDLVFFLV